MTRTLLAAAAALVMSAAASLAPSAFGGELPAQLKPTALLESDVIRLGDLWENLGDKANTPVASAPQPGKRVTLEARWLAAVAQANGIDWRPATVFEKSTVERAGHSVDLHLVETELREALALEGAPANAKVELTNRSSLQIVVPTTVAPTVGVRDVSYDARLNRFSATVEVPAGSPAATRVKVGGYVFATTRLPVLTHTMGRGEVITEKDIQWLDVREDQVRRDIVSNPSALVGMEPRYQLRAGMPVRTAEVSRPIAVNRNTTVTMIYKTKLMTLTAQGRAAEDGSTGDTIRVTNVQTKQTVEARVEGPGMVSVALGGPRVLSN